VPADPAGTDARLRGTLGSEPAVLAAASCKGQAADPDRSIFSAARPFCIHDANRCNSSVESFMHFPRRLGQRQSA